MKKLILIFLILGICISFTSGDFDRTTGLIDIPSAKVIPGGTYKVFLTGIFAVGKDDYPVDFNTGFAYGIGDWGEVTLSMLTTVDYSINFNSVLIRGSGSVPSIGFGIHNITYRKYISELGQSKEVGYSDDIDYEKVARRPSEQFSVYFVATRDLGGYWGEHTIGLGRGKYVGYGPNSHLFNTDMLFVSNKQSELLGKAQEHAFGLFFGSRWKIIEPLSFMLEFDGRDVNTGLRYKLPYLELDLAWTHVEQVGKKHRPRISLGASVSSMVLSRAPTFAFLSLHVYDKETGKVLDFNVNLEKGKMSRTLEGKAGRINLKLLPGEYKMKVVYPGYKWKKIKLLLTEGEKKSVKIGLSKKISKEDIEREKEFDSNYVKGVTAYNSKNYKAAITFLEKCMKLKPENEDAANYLEKAKVDFFVQCEGLKSAAVKLEEKKDYKGALIKYQELLYLDPDNKEISVKVDEMTEKIQLEKKKKVKKKAPPGVSDLEIDKWYKAGLSHFGNGNYKNAIAMFEKVLRYRPKHSGARKYLGKARTRLKATGQ